MTFHSPWDQPAYQKKKRKETKKVPARKKVTEKAKKKVTEKARKAKKAEQRVDRWREQQLYQAKDSPFRPADYEILFSEPGNRNSNISRGDVLRFLDDHHYLGTLPNSAHYLYGMWHKPTKELVGVAAYGSPGSPPVLESSFPGLEAPKHKKLDVEHFKQTGKKLWLPAPRKVSQYALELLRLALLTGVPKNAESWFVDKTFDRLRGMDKRGVISFSDPDVGHVGTVYKALSAVYTGTSRPEWQWRFPDGVVYHNRHKTKIEAADPCHGSGKSTSGLAEAKGILTKWGGPPRRGECLRKWMARVLKKHADRVPGPGKMRYVWGLTKTQESEIRQRQKRGEKKVAELHAKGWDEDRIRRYLERKRYEIEHTKKGKEKRFMLQRFPYYPCGACLDPFPDHKTEDCPQFDPLRGAAQTVSNPDSFQSPWDQPAYGKRKGRRRASRARPRISPVESVVRHTEGWIDELAEGTPQERSKRTSPLQTEDVMLFVYWAPGVMRRELAQAWLGEGDPSAVRFAVMRRDPSGRWYLRQERDADLEEAAREFVSSVGAGRAQELVRQPVHANPVNPILWGRQ